MSFSVNIVLKHKVVLIFLGSKCNCKIPRFKNWIKLQARLTFLNLGWTRFWNLHFLYRIWSLLINYRFKILIKWLNDLILYNVILVISWSRHWKKLISSLFPSWLLYWLLFKAYIKTLRKHVRSGNHKCSIILHEIFLFLVNKLIQVYSMTSNGHLILHFRQKLLKIVLAVSTVNYAVNLAHHVFIQSELVCGK